MFVISDEKPLSFPEKKKAPIHWWCGGEPGGWGYCGELDEIQYIDAL